MRKTNLTHVAENLVAAPAREIPVVKVLFGSADAKCAVTASGASEELATT